MYVIYNFCSNSLALFCFEALGVIGYFFFLMQTIARYICFTSYPYFSNFLVGSVFISPVVWVLSNIYV